MESRVGLLSPRQREMMQYFADGDTSNQITMKMGLGKSTVSHYVRRAKTKLGARSLYQCIAILVSRGEIVVKVADNNEVVNDGKVNG